MGLSVRLLNNINSGRHPSPAVALLASRVARTTIERILGGIASADRCPHCGAPKGAT
jgi:hypothetical protein